MSVTAEKIRTKDALKLKLKKLEQENERLKKALFVLAEYVDELNTEIGIQATAEYSLKKLFE